MGSVKQHDGQAEHVTSPSLLRKRTSRWELSLTGGLLAARRHWTFHALLRPLVSRLLRCSQQVLVAQPSSQVSGMPLCADSRRQRRLPSQGTAVMLTLHTAGLTGLE